MSVLRTRINTSDRRIPLGTVYTFDHDDAFVVPSNGWYEVQMYGGGGAAARSMDGLGAGSGQSLFLNLHRGDVFPISIGAGGSGVTRDYDDNLTGNPGGATSFGSYSVAGGLGGKYYSEGGGFGAVASGNIGCAGGADADGTPYSLLGSGLGNINNDAVGFGHGGGYVGSYISGNGSDGGVVIQYFDTADRLPKYHRVKKTGLSGWVDRSSRERVTGSYYVTVPGVGAYPAFRDSVGEHLLAHGTALTFSVSPAGYYNGHIYIFGQEVVSTSGSYTLTLDRDITVHFSSYEPSNTMDIYVTEGAG